MKIAMIGTGYVGLVTGTCLANLGNHVVCVDVDEDKIAALNRGEIPIYEEGLEPLIDANVEAGRLAFTTDSGGAIRDAEVIFIAVGTPSDTDGSADLKYVLKVAETIGEAMNGYKIIVCKSTVPVGTCDRVAEVVASRTNHDFDVVSNPEFLKEGSAVQDFQSPDRVVIGSRNPAACEKIAELYQPLMRRSDRILTMDVCSAEMTKYASNSMLAAKISFINEIANICERVGADVEMVRRGMSLDQRIGPHFIYPGVGYGGSCFPKDIRALARLGQENGVDTRMLCAVDDTNEHQKGCLVRFAEQYFDSLEGKRFAIWGLSFKPKTADIREAPAIIAIRQLVEAGATVVATDPVAIENSRDALADLDGVHFVASEYGALQNADALFVFTEWSQYRNPNFERMRELMRHPVIFDGRNLYRPERMREAGFAYLSVGRLPREPQDFTLISTESTLAAGE